MATTRGRRRPRSARGTRRWREVIVPSVLRRDGRICHLCGRSIPKGDGTADHLVPVSLGGTDHWDNLAAAHRQCNLIRGNRSVPVARADIAGQVMRVSVHLDGGHRW